MVAAIVLKIKSLIEEGNTVYHFGFGQSPFPVPEPFVNGLRRHAHCHEYLPTSGLQSLREKIVNFHREWRDFDHFRPDMVVVAGGSKELLYLILTVFDGEVLLQSPFWTTYLPQTKMAERKTHIIATAARDKYLISGEALEKVILTECDNESNKLLIINNPNNPAGTAFSAHRLRNLAAVCRKHKIVVISDEIYARLHFDGNHISIAQFYPEGTIVTSGFSKWASAGGWRAGYALFPSELTSLRNAVVDAGSQTYSCCPSPVQYALNDGLEHKDELRAYILATRKILNSVGHYVHQQLILAGVAGIAPEAAYYYMPDFAAIRGGLTSAGMENCAQMCDRLLDETGVALMPCAAHFGLQDLDMTTRLCFVNFDGQRALEDVLANTHNDIKENFIKLHCPLTVEGVNKLKLWVSQFASNC